MTKNEIRIKSALLLGDLEGKGLTYLQPSSELESVTDEYLERRYIYLDTLTNLVVLQDSGKLTFKCTNPATYAKKLEIEISWLTLDEATLVNLIADADECFTEDSVTKAAFYDATQIKVAV